MPSAPVNWGPYEQDILRLYVEQDKTAVDTLSCLNRQHGTHFTLRQFKAKFGGLKKLRDDEWQAIDRRICQLRDQGKVSEVYLFGQRQDSVRVQRFILHNRKRGNLSTVGAEKSVDLFGRRRLEIRTPPPPNSPVVNALNPRTVPQQQLGNNSGVTDARFTHQVETTLDDFFVDLGASADTVDGMDFDFSVIDTNHTLQTDTLCNSDLCGEDEIRSSQTVTLDNPSFFLSEHHQLTSQPESRLSPLAPLRTIMPTQESLEVNGFWSRLPQLDSLGVDQSKGQTETRKSIAENVEITSPTKGDLGSEVQSKNDLLSDDSDVQTIYSVGSDSGDRKLSYLNAVADKIAEDIQGRSDALINSDIGPGTLDKMIKKFAWKLHEESSNPFQWEVSVTIHQMRKEIVDRLGYHMDHNEIETLVTNDEAEEELLNDRRPSGLPSEFIWEWLNEVEDPPERADVDEIRDDIPNFTNLSQILQYNKFISESEAYQCFISELYHTSHISVESSGAMFKIGSTVRKELRTQNPLHKMSRRRPSLINMTYEVDWELIQFAQNQSFESSTTDIGIFEEGLCLTGSWREAQATTISGYMHQTWPRTADGLISLLRKLMSQPEGQVCSVQPLYEAPLDVPKLKQKFSGQGIQKLTAHMESSSNCIISATGGPYFISEIAEQLAWLVSAARTPSNKHGIVACTPYVTNIRINKGNGGSQITPIEGFGEIKFNFEEKTEMNGSTPGSCWGPLMSGRTLVTGYPILRREEQDTGLELTLLAMARLIQCQTVVQWKNKIMMKGFRSLLVATLLTENVVVWHLFASESPDERISYSDLRLETLQIKIPDDFSLRMLEQSRHIIGWCTKAIDLCGHSKSNYAIRPSALKRSPHHNPINLLHINSALNGDLGLRMPANTNPLWQLSISKDYPTLLNWIAIQPIVFYDVLENRGWLVDGASALLHLLRTSLHHDLNNPNYFYEWVFDATQLNEMTDTLSGRSAACKFLSDSNNMNLPLYVCNQVAQGGLILETKYSKLGDKIEELLHKMEVIIEWNKETSIQNARSSKTPNSPKSIVGFDIMEIPKQKGQICPRIKLTNLCNDGWIDLVQSTGITTIFGNGFGDLIVPKESNSSCSYWNSVPCGKSYMAASVSTLKMLHREYFQDIDPEIGIDELTSMLSWSSLFEPFKPCRCFKGKSVANEDHDNPVHYLISKSSKRVSTQPDLSPVSLSTLVKEGAVIFGHVESFPCNIDSHLATQDSFSHVAISTSSLQNSKQEMQDSFATSTSNIQSESTKNMTIPSLGSSNTEQGRETTYLKDDHNNHHNVNEEPQAHEENKSAEKSPVRKNRFQKAKSIVRQLFKSRNIT